MILIVTIDDDLHGLAVQAELRSRGLLCHIVASDTITGTECLSVLINSCSTHATILTTENIEIDPADADVIWLRRPKSLQTFANFSPANEHHRNLINNDIGGTLNGILQTIFVGHWISEPRATERASNKLIQLNAAVRVGLQIPPTLVSQIPADVANFYQRNGGAVIVKPVVGTPGPLVFTRMIDPVLLAAEDSIRSCPAIYQAFVQGTRHIRLNLFGERSYGFAIDSLDLDWRPNLNVAIAAWDVPRELHNKLRSLLNDLGLAMGIFDIKEGPSGELFFLEVNPQGQFLFLEGITKEPLTRVFADFLEESLSKGYGPFGGGEATMAAPHGVQPIMG